MMKFILRLFFAMLALAAVVVLLYVGSFAYYQPREGYIAIAYNNEDGYTLAEDLQLWDIKRMLPFGSKIVYLSNSFYLNEFDVAGSLGHVDLFTDSTPFVNSNFFTYHLKGQLAFKLPKDSLLKALNDGTVESKKLNQFYSEQATLINNEMASLMEALLHGGNSFTSDTSRNSVALLMMSDLDKKFPTLEWQPLTFTTFNMPNLTLYQEVLNASLVKVQAIAEAQRQVQYQVAQQAATQEQRLKLLEEYGKLLTQYPILIQFFAVDSGKVLPRETLEALMPAPTVGN